MPLVGRRSMRGPRESKQRIPCPRTATSILRNLGEIGYRSPHIKVTSSFCLLGSLSMRAPRERMHYDASGDQSERR